MQIPLMKGDKISVDTDYKDALPVNMMAIEKDILKAKGYMLCYPGLTSFATGSGVDRGGFYNERQSNHFRVSGTKFISVSSSGVVTELGDIEGTGQVAMPYSFNTQAIIGNGQMFLYDTSNGFREVTDEDLGSPIDGTWVDGYYCLTDGEYIYHTDVDDESAIDPLKFATAEFMPDPSLGVGKTHDNKWIVFGRFTMEYFVNDASEDFSFLRLETRAHKIGIVATHAKCEAGGNWYIVGGRRGESVGVHVVGTARVEKVSTREVDETIGKYTEPELSDIRLESRIEKNVSFVILHLPNETLILNRNIAKSMGIKNAWSILKTGIKGESNYRAINGIFDGRISKWIYGDKRDSSIGLLDNTVFTHYDDIQEWEIFSPFLKLETMSINSLEIETIPGHNTDEDAKVFLSMSYNGVTYGTEWSMEYGDPLDYSQRFIARRLGYVPDWVGIKLRGATRSRMAFAYFDIDFS